MLFAFQFALALAYTLLAHLASARHAPILAAVALVALVLLVLAAPLAHRRAWAWLALPVLLAGVWILHRIGQAPLPMLLVPVAFIGLVAFWFGRSLRPRRVPLITKIVAALDRQAPEAVPSELRRYTRGLTAAWAWLLAALAAINLAMAMIAVPDGLLARLGIAAPVSITHAQWSFFANVCNYGIVGGFFLLEYQLRKRRFPGRYKHLLDFGRRMAALGPAFWRDFLK